MSTNVTDAELSAYLDEDLSEARMTHLEERLREDEQLRARLSGILGQRDAGVHSIGAIWRRHRLSCPSREQLGSYLLGVLEDDHRAYVKFHLEVIGCRQCNANLDDLQAQNSEAEVADQIQSRRHKYFQSSAGYLSSSD